MIRLKPKTIVGMRNSFCLIKASEGPNEVTWQTSGYTKSGYIFLLASGFIGSVWSAFYLVPYTSVADQWEILLTFCFSLGLTLFGVLSWNRLQHRITLKQDEQLLEFVGSEELEQLEVSRIQSFSVHEENFDNEFHFYYAQARLSPQKRIALIGSSKRSDIDAFLKHFKHIPVVPDTN